VGKRWGSEIEGAGNIFRFSFLKIFVVAIFLILFASLARLQIFQGEYFRSLANGNRIRENILHAPRGVVFDRHETPLLVNIPAFRLRNCNLEETDCQTSVISKDQAIELEARGLKPGQKLEVDAVRQYLFGPIMGHLLGYVNEVSKDELGGSKKYLLGDRIGRGGVEQFFQSDLRGRDGKQLVEIDATGKGEKVASTIDPIPGRNLTLSVDLNLQKTAYEAIKNVTGAVVASDPRTGEMLTIVSSPSFDPNLFTDLLLSSDERGAKISALFSGETQPLFDRVISGTYPPGSTFKLITSIAGLETGGITPSTTIDDPGILIIGPYKFPNWRFLRDGGKQGILDVVGAIQKSNDIFFYRTGEWTGLDNLTSWAEKFGLSKPLGIDLPGEVGGSVPDAAWRAANARKWYLGDTYHLAIGQGELLVTPLQVNFWTNVFANGGNLCQPTVVLGKGGNCRSLGINPKNLALVKKGMLAACSDGGTAYPLFNFKDPKNLSQIIKIACKTGTAEFGDAKDRTHAWLTAFAPADNPQIAVTALVEAGGEGSDVAAPIVKKVLEAWFK
jgi:penicillin-binding protein 2